MRLLRWIERVLFWVEDHLAEIAIVGFALLALAVWAVEVS